MNGLSKPCVDPQNNVKIHPMVPTPKAPITSEDVLSLPLDLLVRCTSSSHPKAKRSPAITSHRQSPLRLGLTPFAEHFPRCLLVQGLVAKLSCSATSGVKLAKGRVSASEIVGLLNPTSRPLRFGLVGGHAFGPCVEASPGDSQQFGHAHHSEVVLHAPISL